MQKHKQSRTCKSDRAAWKTPRLSHARALMSVTRRNNTTPPPSISPSLPILAPLPLYSRLLDALALSAPFAYRIRLLNNSASFPFPFFFALYFREAALVGNDDHTSMNLDVLQTISACPSGAEEGRCV